MGIIVMIHQESLCREASFFLTEKESDAILEAVTQKKPNGKKKDDNNFKISGIFYINEDNWTVWINGIEYSTIGQHRHFSIDSVTESDVSLTLNDGTLLNLSVTTAEEQPPQSEPNTIENK
jgi:hypothetical protein